MRNTLLCAAIAISCLVPAACRTFSPGIEVVVGADRPIESNPEWRQKVTELWDESSRRFHSHSGVVLRLSQMSSWFPRSTGSSRRKLWSGLPVDVRRRDAIAVLTYGATAQSRGTPFDDQTIIVLNPEGSDEANIQAIQQAFHRMFGVEGAEPDFRLLRETARFPLKGGLEEWTAEKERYLHSAWKRAGRREGDLRTFLAEIFESQGLMSQAVKYRGEVAAANPDDLGSLFRLAVTQQRASDPNEAAQTLSRLIALSPNFDGAHRELGIAYALTNRKAEAEAEFQKALELDPADHTARLNLGAIIIEQLGRREEGTAHFKEILRRNPEDAAARRNLELATAAHKSLTQTIRKLEIETGNTGSASQYLQLGMANARLGHFHEATQALRRSIALDPSSGQARQSLATVALLRRDYASALAQVREMKNRGITVDPKFEESCLRAAGVSHPDAQR